MNDVIVRTDGLTLEIERVIDAIAIHAGEGVEDLELPDMNALLRELEALGVHEEQQSPIWSCLGVEELRALFASIVE